MQSAASWPRMVHCQTNYSKCFPRRYCVRLVVATSICLNCKQHVLKAALCKTTFLTICVACPAFKFVLGRRPTLHKLCALQNNMTVFTGRVYDTPRLYNRTNTYVATQRQTHIINCRNQTPPTNRCCQQCYGTLACNDASHDYVYIS